jgi:preprotein translocase subunit YajC
MYWKKILSLVTIAAFLLLALTGCTATSTDGGTTGAFDYSTILMILMVIAVFYFFAIRPESKRKKKAQEMRSSIEAGDNIVTIGGMLGKVVHVSDDKLTFETGEDRVRIEAFKWAVSENKGKGANRDKGDSEEMLR